jgi:hypothetical protein
LKSRDLDGTNLAGTFRVNRCVVLATLSMTLGWATPSVAQTPPSHRLAADAGTPDADHTIEEPITRHDRLKWLATSTWSPSSLLVGGAESLWSTATNAPPEWHRTPAGFGRRLADIEAATAISNTVEAGLGAAWQEDPRYVPSRRQGVWRRLRYSAIATVTAPRGDGHVRVAWARLAGNSVATITENTWLPAPLKTPGGTTIRLVDGVAGRFVSNLWSEFWPDVRRRVAGGI